ncbi:MAG: hypothetical protein HWE39_04070 [Oceanospirillaceae bacterium]|nr:hypothetical protein [Oceanospirillaceae bacterium]
MITSTLFRHGLKPGAARDQIDHRLQRLERAAPRVTRVDIVVDQVAHQGQANKLYQCHISLRAAGRKTFDIYTNNGSISTAVADAFDQMFDLIRFRGLGAGQAGLAD